MPPTSNSTSTAEDGMPVTGQMIEQYRVGIKLGQGGFGAVYKVSNTQTGETLAMKCESQAAKKKGIWIEAQVLRGVSRGDGGNAHFCKVQQRGTTPLFEWLAMTMVGKNLSELRKAQKGRRFSLSTTVRIGIQTLDSIKYLHDVGFVHRDIKPANFAIGTEQSKETNMIYVLDFGMCRPWCDPKTKRPKVPRPDVGGFRGTLRYAPINSHLNKELGRKDDLEMWLYMLIELVKGGLPWKHNTIHKAVAEMKLKLRDDNSNQDHVMKDLPLEFKECMARTHSYQYEHTPNYQFFHDLLNEIMCRGQFKMSDHFDWELQPPNDQGSCSPEDEGPRVAVVPGQGHGHGHGQGHNTTRRRKSKRRSRSKRSHRRRSRHKNKNKEPVPPAGNETESGEKLPASRETTDLATQFAARINPSLSP